jgi:hypothetical protein
MTRRLAAGVAIGSAMLLSIVTPAYAHRTDEYLQAAMISVSRDRVRLEIRLTPGIAAFPTVIAGIDADGDGVLSVTERSAYTRRVLADVSLTVDGLRLPLRAIASRFAEVGEMKEGLGEIQLDFEAAVPDGDASRRLTFENHHQRAISVYLVNALVPEDSAIRITGQRRSYEQQTFAMEYVRTGATTALARTGGTPSRSELTGYAGMVKLGMRHIADGTDHLLFLLALLLPAPLAAIAGRWTGYSGARRGAGRLLRIVTAFTLGHSLTLALGATGIVRAPVAIVEVLVAVSILVSAVHALRPIFPGREALVAGGFGLVHGLAFATTIADYGIDPWHTALTVLGFNVGIELMQLAIRIATVPWLFALARTPAYAWLRVSGAVVAGVAAVGWIGERAFGLGNPVGVLIESAAHRGPLLAAVLAVPVLVVGGLQVPRLRAARSAREDRMSMSPEP